MKQNTSLRAAAITAMMAVLATATLVPMPASAKRRAAANGPRLETPLHRSAAGVRGGKPTTGLRRAQGPRPSAKVASPDARTTAASRKVAPRKQVSRIPLRQYLSQKFYAALGLVAASGIAGGSGWVTSELFRGIADSPHPVGYGFIGLAAGTVALAGAFMTSVFTYALFDTSVKIAKSSDAASPTAP